MNEVKKQVLLVAVIDLALLLLLVGANTGFFVSTPAGAAKLASPVCGNGACEPLENQSSCCLDCGCPIGNICNITTKSCFEETFKVGGIHLSDAKVSGAYEDPEIIYVGNTISLSVMAEKIGEFDISRVWVDIAEPTGKNATVNLTSSTNKNWIGGYIIPTAGDYAAIFNALDQGGYSAEPIRVNFTALTLQVGPFIPFPIPGYV